MRLVTPLAAAALLIAGALTGWLLGKRGEPETTTVTAAAAAGLPDAVERTRAAVVSAAERKDWAAVRDLLGPGFKYTFGSPVEGGAVAYWQRLERESGDQPLEILTEILRLPYTLSRGTYYWPFAYDKRSDELTDHERQLLEPLGRSAAFADGYLGWRVGIQPNGDWVFFVAGD